MSKSEHEVYLSRNDRSLEQRLRYKASMMAAHARERGIAWNLTEQDIIDMWNQQKGLSAYSGRRMALTIGRGLIHRNWVVSIDRLDPSLGYEKDNVVLCRYDENRQKAQKNFFDVEFMDTFPEFVSNALKYRTELQEIAA